MNNYKFDITIIGGGASGIMAAISAMRNNMDLKVAIVEGSFSIGRKVLLSGAGRCNLTNSNLAKKDFINHYDSDNTSYVENILKAFNYEQIVKFFKDLGIDVFEETAKNQGKIYPINESAKNVISILAEELNRLGVEIFLNTECTDISKIDGNFMVDILEDGRRQIIQSTKVILTTGGMSYPSIGSYGKGYDIAKKFGHKIVNCIPVAVPLLSKDEICRESIGTKVKSIMSTFINNIEVENITDDLLFTNYGVSGSGILRLSRRIAKEFEHNKNIKVSIGINFLPGLMKEDFIARLSVHESERLWIILLGLLPSKLVEYLLKETQISKEKYIKDLSEVERKKIIDALYDKIIRIWGTKGWNEAEFTSGGLTMNEIKSNSLESIFEDGLYFAGEMLNVDGEIGGYNLSWAWASGFVAGKECSN